MRLLSDEEIDALWLPDGIAKPQMIVRRAIVRAAEKAFLEKLASAELPEKVVIDRHESGIVIRGYTADQLRQAYAQGFAAGAAAQLAHEPVGHFTFKGASQIWEETTKSSGTPLYTRREAK